MTIDASDRQTARTVTALEKPPKLRNESKAIDDIKSENKLTASDSPRMEAQPREVRNYRREDGNSPFEDWLNALRDREAKAKIKARLRRVSLDNLGDYKSVGDGVCELRVDYSSGYRVYFGQIGTTVVLLLCGGDKGTQNQDIRKAKEYWADYEKREDANE